MARRERFHVFLSAADANLVKGRALRDALYNQAVEPFLYDDTVRSEAIWREQIQPKLNCAAVLVPIYSDALERDDWLQREISHALCLSAVGRIRIIPVLADIESVPPSSQLHSFVSLRWHNDISGVAASIGDAAKNIRSQLPSDDPYWIYLAALAMLLQRADQQHSSYKRALVYQYRLNENVSRTRKFGDTDSRRAERAEIIDSLNAISLETMSIPYNEICSQFQSFGAESNLAVPSDDLTQFHSYVHVDPFMFPDHENLGLIGTGGFADVYSATRVSTGRVEAIKVLRSALRHILEYQRRFFRGAEQQQKLDHPNIVQVYEINYRAGWYAMEYMDWGDLDRWVKTRLLRLDEIMDLYEQICSAVAYAHSRGILHRDIKPANILMNSLCEAKLTDFDLAFFTEMTGYTRTGAALGSLPFLAPELLSDARNCSQQSDIYSLGAVLFYLLTGKSALLATMDKIDIRAAIEEVGRERMIEAVLLATDPKPFKRVASAEKLQELLRSLQKRKAPAVTNSEAADISHSNSEKLEAMAVHLLSDRNVWNSTPSTLQDTAIGAVARYLSSQFSHIGTEQFLCGGVTHRIGVFQCRVTGIVLHLVPGGTFLMGSQDSEAEYQYCLREYPDWQRRWNEREIPTRELQVLPFLVGRYPVLQAEWDRLKEQYGLRDKRTVAGEDYPLERVSWDDIQPFLAATRLRLLREAEWEYACRAAVTSRFYWGDEMDPSYCWYAGNSEGSVQPVRKHARKANAFGLVDMLGNVWEWCEDRWHDNYQSAPQTASAWQSGESRHSVQRGGGWNNHPSSCRCAFRSSWAREDRLDNTGFRVAFSLME